VKPSRWTPRPVREAVQPCRRWRAEAPKGLLVDERANRHAGSWHLEAAGQPQRLSHGAKRRAGSKPGVGRLHDEHSGGQNPLCARSEPHHPDLEQDVS
jgi:hypothetical protein